LGLRENYRLRPKKPMQTSLTITTRGQGLYEITDEVRGFLYRSDIVSGLVNIFLLHTSAGLIIQENADPSARHDLEQWLNRLIPEKDPNFTHTTEGADDMPAHIKSVLTGCTLTIPIIEGTLGLGTWQGIYLWEHRRAPHRRKVVITVLGDGEDR
jgi:secondary thiamine-phosphate synthase enzyme